MLAPRADVVVRIGAVRYSPEMLAKQLTGAGLMSRRRVRLVSYEVSDIKRTPNRFVSTGFKGVLG